VLYRLPWPEGLSFMFTQVSDGRITSHFTKAMLNAIDIAMPVGVPVLAARSGVVEALEVEHRSGLEDEPLTYEGNFVRLRHEDGTAAIYAHLAWHGIAVAIGEHVQAGQLLAYSGASGDVTQAHLHFAVTRTEKNASGWPEEISIPVQFYVGVPPVVFAPRAALSVTASYSGAAPAPRAPSDWQPLVPWRPAMLGPWAEAGAWALLAACFASGVAGMMWFWRFSRQ
jgi:murein DD-endopeptidase MepM/ murein hydrolase activator NlpD